MASVYKKKGTKNFYCTYTASNGRKVHRTTGKTKRSEALKVALVLEDLEKQQKAAESDKQRKLVGLVKDAAEYAAKSQLTHSRARDIVSDIMELRRGCWANRFSCSCTSYTS